jgi:hypothetical protein
MRCTPSSATVPYGADRTLYVVVDHLRQDDPETERADIEAVVCDMMSGLFGDPVRVVAFNTLEHWIKDVSDEVATEIQSRCDIDGVSLPEHIEDFVKRSLARSRPN